jgi:HAMP domain-containing protein
MEMCALHLGSRIAAIPMDRVREVFIRPQLSALPLSPSCLAGLVGFRGDVIPVIHLDQCLGGKADAGSGARNRVVILQTARGLLGLLVDPGRAGGRCPPGPGSRRFPDRAGANRLTSYRLYPPRFSCSEIEERINSTTESHPNDIMNTPESTPSRRGIGMIIKIAFACILLAAIATIGTALTCSILSGSRLESLAQNRLQATASLMKSKLTSLQDHYQSASRQLAGSSLIRRALTDLQQDPASANARGLLRAGFELSGADGVYLVGSDGTILAQEGGVVTSETWATGMYPTADLIQSVSQTGELAAAFWSSPKNDADSRFFYALPVEGTDRSVVLVEFSADELIQTIQFEGRPRDAGLGETGECYLIGSDKVARTPVRTGMGNQMDSEGVRRALAREEGSSIYANYSGDTVIGAYTSFQGPGQNWGLLVEQGQAEALAGAGNPILVNTGIAIAFIILIGIGALIWAKLFVRPIQALDETMRRISDGDDNARSPVLSHDEIGQLAENFNRLVEERNTARDRVTTDSKRLQNNIQELLLVVADASEGKLSVHARKTEGILGNVADALNRMLQNVGVLIGEAKNASSQVEQAAAEISAYAEALTQEPPSNRSRSTKPSRTWKQ